MERAGSFFVFHVTERFVFSQTVHRGAHTRHIYTHTHAIERNFIARTVGSRIVAGEDLENWKVIIWYGNRKRRVKAQR
jgi:hypothetical protein